MGRKKSTPDIEDIANNSLRSKIIVKGKELTEKQKVFLNV